MMKKYIISYEIMFYQGLIELVLSIIIFIIAKNIGYLYNFSDYYNVIDATEIIVYISLTFVQFIYGLSSFILIEKYSQFYVLLLFMFAELIYYFHYSVVEGALLSILSTIIIIVCFLTILIFVEIIQLNFCGLSYMTKKNIKIRARLDSVIEINEEEDETKIDYRDYSIDLNDAKLTEMIPIDSKSYNDNNNE